MARRVDLATLRFEAADTEKDSPVISANKGVHQGQMVGFKIVMPHFVNAITAVVKILDGDGDIIYTSGNQANSATSVVMALNVPLIEKEKIRVTLSGPHGGVAPDNFGDVKVRLYYNPDAQIP